MREPLALFPMIFLAASKETLGSGYNTIEYLLAKYGVFLSPGTFDATLYAIKRNRLIRGEDK